MAHRGGPQPDRVERLERPGRGGAPERPRLGGGLDPLRGVAAGPLAGREEPLARGGAPPRLERREPADDPLAPRSPRPCGSARRRGSARAAASSRRAPATRSSSSPTTSWTSRASSGARCATSGRRTRSSASSATSPAASARGSRATGRASSDLVVGRLETEEERLARVAQYDFPAELASSVPADPIITSFPVNGATGRSWGFDVLVQKRPTPGARLTGWASYTWGRAEREEYGRTLPFEYDRRHAASLVGSWRITPKWELGATVRAFSGFPRTPVLGLRVAADETERRPARARARRRGPLRLRDARAAASRTSTPRACPPSSASTCASPGSRGGTRGAGSSTST